MTKPAQNNVLLELHVPDFQKTKEYYKKLGFEIVWERPPEGFKGYLILKMGGISSAFGMELNQFTNKITSNNGLKIQKEVMVLKS